MPESTVASLLERIRVAALKQTVECSALMGDIIDSSIGGSVRCSICGAVSTTAPYLYTLKHSRILNPAFVPLLALVQGKCPNGCPSSVVARELQQENLTCGYCSNTGYVLRTAFIESLNIGMVEGGLIAALGAIWRSVLQIDRMQARIVSALIERLSGWAENEGDYRIEALTVVAEWLDGSGRVA